MFKKKDSVLEFISFGERGKRFFFQRFHWAITDSHNRQNRRDSRPNQKGHFHPLILAAPMTDNGKENDGEHKKDSGGNKGEDNFHFSRAAGFVPVVGLWRAERACQQSFLLSGANFFRQPSQFPTLERW